MLDGETTTHHHKQQQYRQTNEQLVFKLDNDADDDDVDCAFEKTLDEIMNNWILVYLPSIVNKIMQQGNQPKR
jgi:hypothetical protein